MPVLEMSELEMSELQMPGLEMSKLEMSKLEMSELEMSDWDEKADFGGVRDQPEGLRGAAVAVAFPPSNPTIFWGRKSDASKTTFQKRRFENDISKATFQKRRFENDVSSS
jgi:hypothetical protein